MCLLMMCRADQVQLSYFKCAATFAENKVNVAVEFNCGTTKAYMLWHVCIIIPVMFCLVKITPLPVLR